MKITIAIAARKGGVGKTALAVGLAHRFVAIKRSVAIVDLDPQSNVAAMVGGDPVAPGAGALLARHAVTPQECLGIQIYAGGPSLDDPSLITRLDPEDLRIARAKIPADIVIVDCPPGHQHLERLAIRAADIALIPFEPHPVAVIGMRRVIEGIEADRQVGRIVPRHVAVVISRFDPRQKRLHGNARELIDFWTGPVHTLRWDAALAQAMALAEAPGSCRAVEDLDTMRAWILSLR